MKQELLKKEKMNELFNHLMDQRQVDTGYDDINEFIEDLSEILHHNKHFKRIKEQLKDHIEFRQRFEEEIKKIVLLKAKV